MYVEDSGLVARKLGRRDFMRGMGLTILGLALPLTSLSQAEASTELARTLVPKITGPVNGGKGVIFSSPLENLAARGYVMEEFFVEGVAHSYDAAPGTTAGPDGKWETVPTGTASYKTRLYCVRPQDPAKFNGIVLQNWQNVTGNLDVGAPFGEESFNGYAWIGVSVQKLGIDGLPGKTRGLAAWDPDRYGSLNHPGDAFSYDIFGQVARYLKDTSSDGPQLLGGATPKTLVATGFSQSAMRLASYINAAHQHDKLFDAFFLRVHWGMAPPLSEIPLLEQFGPRPGGTFAATAQINDRGDTPILVLSSESESVVNFPARQANSSTFRFWEIAGAPHLAPSEAESIAAIRARDEEPDAVAPPDRNITEWGYVRDAALRHLVRWIDKVQPAEYPLINIETEQSGAFAIQRDANGNALGGLRLPEVVAAIGEHSGGNPAQLHGSTRLFSRDEMLAIHGDRTSFLRAWDGCVDDLVKADLMLESEAVATKGRGRTFWPET